MRITSQDKGMFNFFQTFSAADLHWDNLHRLFPNSDQYLGKKPVDSLLEVPEEEKTLLKVSVKEINGMYNIGMKSILFDKKCKIIS